jgi:hypothetical protein
MPRETVPVARRLLQRLFGQTTSDVRFSSLEQMSRNWAARHFRLKATQHVVHWLGVELVAYS